MCCATWRRERALLWRRFLCDAFLRDYCPATCVHKTSHLILVARLRCFPSRLDRLYQIVLCGLTRSRAGLELFPCRYFSEPVHFLLLQRRCLFVFLPCVMSVVQPPPTSQHAHAPPINLIPCCDFLFRGCVCLWGGAGANRFGHVQLRGGERGGQGLGLHWAPEAL